MWLENSGFGTWVRESQSLWAFPSVLALHTIGLGLLVGASGVVGLRILGVAPLIPLAPMERFFGIMWFGFWVNALSGTALFIAGATRHASNPAFYVKMACVVFGVVNVQLLRREVFRDLSGVGAKPVATKAQILAGTSLALWIAAITAGRLMAYLGDKT